MCVHAYRFCDDGREQRKAKGRKGEPATQKNQQSSKGSHNLDTQHPKFSKSAGKKKHFRFTVFFCVLCAHKIYTHIIRTGRRRYETTTMKRSVGLFFFALTLVVFLLSCGVSVTDGARMLKQNYESEDGDFERIENNAIRRRTTKNEEEDEAAIEAATREEEEEEEEEEIENTQLNEEEESELEQVKEEVVKEASEMSSSSSSENADEITDSSSQQDEGGDEKLSAGEKILEKMERTASNFWESMTGQPEGKEKDLIDKIVETHSLESAPLDGFLMDDADSECGPSGPFALMTIWNTVDKFRREKLIDFFAQHDDDVSTSDPTWSTVAVKSLKLSGVFSTRFAGEGESKRECIANFLTNNKMRQLEDVNRAKGIETSRPHQTERQRDLAKGKEARLLRNFVLTKILPSAQILEARGTNDEATVLVLALNCKVEKRRALLFALFDAVISTLKLNANEVALSLGRRHVTQDMYELINRTPGQLLGEEGGDKFIYKRGDDPIIVKAGICPTLVGIHDADEGDEGFGDEREQLQRAHDERDHLERAHARARDHFSPHRSENHHDPTNPHHQHTHGSHHMGSLPGMQSVFGSNSMNMPGGRGGSSNNRAKQLGMSAFGISDHAAMLDPRSRRNEGGTQPKSNYVPTLEDPLQGYLNSHPAPRRHRARGAGTSETL